MYSQLESQASSEAGLGGLLRRQLTRPKPLPTDIKLSNQVAIVTGSNIGLGLSASHQLLHLGLRHLIMGVRSQSKGDSAAASLRASFPSATISVWLLDMESYDSIQSFAEKGKSLPRLDIVILNAGLMSQMFTVSKAGNHEVTMQVNYLSTVLLAVLLLPILKEKRDVEAERAPVLSIVGSDAAYNASLAPSLPILPQFDNEKSFNQLMQYNNSKLLLIFFVAKLAELVNPEEVVINVVNPGMTKGTAFFAEVPWFLKWAVVFVQFCLARTVEVGASTYLDATVVKGRESHGGFVGEWRVKP
jgi:NAD(P)-dependent dehydrogenase (short-subunit alcohol dehydrogenase family)